MDFKEELTRKIADQHHLPTAVAFALVGHWEECEYSDCEIDQFISGHVDELTLERHGVTAEEINTAFESASKAVVDQIMLRDKFPTLDEFAKMIANSTNAIDAELKLKSERRRETD